MRGRRRGEQLLRILALADQADDALSGLELARLAGIRAGSLYPVLSVLEDRGLVEAAWEDGPRPRRRLYSITAAGSAAIAP